MPASIFDPGPRDDSFMVEALEEARKSLALDEFRLAPCSSWTTPSLARAHWLGGSRRRLLDHAEMLVLMEAERSGKVFDTA